MTEKNIDHIIMLLLNCSLFTFYLLLNMQRNRRPQQENPNPNPQTTPQRRSIVEYMYWFAGIGVFLVMIYQLLKK